MLMIVLSTISPIGHLIWDKNQSWPLKLNLIREELDWGKKWRVDFNAGKSNDNVVIDVTMDGSTPEQKLSFKYLVFEVSFS